MCFDWLPTETYPLSKAADFKQEEDGEKKLDRSQQDAGPKLLLAKDSKARTMIRGAIAG